MADCRRRMADCINPDLQLIAYNYKYIDLNELNKIHYILCK
jgi:hypothetical protein